MIPPARENAGANKHRSPSAALFRSCPCCAVPVNHYPYRTSHISDRSPGSRDPVCTLSTVQRLARPTRCRFYERNPGARACVARIQNHVLGSWASWSAVPAVSVQGNDEKGVANTAARLLSAWDEDTAGQEQADGILPPARVARKDGKNGRTNRSSAGRCRGHAPVAMWVGPFRGAHG
jgi:hypothetical protein